MERDAEIARRNRLAKAKYNHTLQSHKRRVQPSLCHDSQGTFCRRMSVRENKSNDMISGTDFADARVSESPTDRVRTRNIGREALKSRQHSVLYYAVSTSPPPDTRSTIRLQATKQIKQECGGEVGISGPLVN